MYYPSFEKEAEPLLNEFGCLHFKFSILLGISRPVYSNEQLEQMKAEDKQTFEFEGKEYTRYEASQLQRKIETAVRHEKDLANMAKASGNDDLRREAQYKINLLTSKYAQLSKASGLPTKMERMQVGGFRRVKTFPSKLAKTVDNWDKAVPTVHTKEKISEVIMYANRRNIKIYNAYTFDGDIDLLKEQLDIIDEMQREYGIKQRLTVKFSEMTDGDYAAYDNGVIVFNKKVLRNRAITNANLNADNILSATNTKGIAAHELGHIISQQYGIKGIDIAKKAWYNIHGENISDSDLLYYIEQNVSEYAVRIKRSGKHARYNELLSEIVSKHITNGNEFTKEFVRIVKELIL